MPVLYGYYGFPLIHNACSCEVQKTVVRTKSVDYMPFLLSFILFINGLTWTVYAVLTRDWFIGVSSHPLFNEKLFYKHFPSRNYYMDIFHHIIYNIFLII